LKFLLAKLNHLGDTLLLTPTLRALRQAHPGATIDVVVRKGCEAVLEGNADISRVIGVPGASAFAAVLGRRYDYAFDLSNSDRAKLLIAASGARVRAINDWHAELGWRARLFNRFTHFAWGPEHQVLRDYRAVADVVPLGPPGPLVLETEPVDAPKGPYVVIHPVSRWKFKQWLPEYWAHVADALPFEVVFSYGPGEAGEIDAISKKHRRIGGLTLRQLGGLIKGARLFLGVDTVAMHIAAAVQTPAVALFGPSSEWSWRPWQAPHELVLGDCSCKRTRKFVCDKSMAYPCMQGIGAGEVLAAARRLLAGQHRAERLADPGIRQ
jgi:heptosyltransferase-3